MGRTKHGKRYHADLAKVPQSPVPVAEAIAILKGFNQTKFDQTVELVLWLGIDPRQADQAIRGSISLPHGIGRTKRVIAFLGSLGLPTSLEEVGLSGAEDRLREHMTRDKKRRGGRLALVLLSEPGRTVMVEDGSVEEVLAAL